MDSLQALLPPDVEHHPDLDFNCPKCAAELQIEVREAYRVLSKWTHAKQTVEDRIRLIDDHWLQVECPDCSTRFKVGFSAAVSVRYSAVSAAIEPKDRVIGAQVRTRESTLPPVETVKF